MNIEVCNDDADGKLAVLIAELVLAQKTCNASDTFCFSMLFGCMADYVREESLSK